MCLSSLRPAAETPRPRGCQPSRRAGAAAEIPWPRQVSRVMALRWRERRPGRGRPRGRRGRGRGPGRWGQGRRRGRGQAGREWRRGGGGWGGGGGGGGGGIRCWCEEGRGGQGRGRGWWEGAGEWHRTPPLPLLPLPPRPSPRAPLRPHRTVPRRIHPRLLSAAPGFAVSKTSCPLPRCSATS